MLQFLCSKILKSGLLKLRVRGVFKQNKRNVVLLHAEWMLKPLGDLLSNTAQLLQGRLSCSFGTYTLKIPINLLNNVDTEV